MCSSAISSLHTFKARSAWGRRPEDYTNRGSHFVFLSNQDKKSKCYHCWALLFRLRRGHSRLIRHANCIRRSLLAWIRGVDKRDNRRMRTFHRPSDLPARNYPKKKSKYTQTVTRTSIPIHSKRRKSRSTWHLRHHSEARLVCWDSFHTSVSVISFNMAALHVWSGCLK